MLSFAAGLAVGLVLGALMGAYVVVQSVVRILFHKLGPLAAMNLLERLRK